MKFLPDFTKFTATATKKFNTAKILTKKHSPLILMVAGGVGLVGTAVTAYQAAKKVDKTMAVFEERLEAGEVVTKKEIAVAVSKDVAMPVLLGAASISCIVLSYTIQNDRLKALTTALAVATEEHARYRLRAKEILDEVTFKKLDAPTETKTIETEEGEKEVTIAKEGDFFGKWFMYSNEYVSGEPAYNEQWIQSVEEKANGIIMRKGVLMYNELMDMLGFDNISNSLPFGWTDNDGFYLEWDEHETWNEKEQWMEPQLYVHWKTPRNLYSATSFKNLIE